MRSTRPQAEEADWPPASVAGHGAPPGTGGLLRESVLHWALPSDSLRSDPGTVS